MLINFSDIPGHQNLFLDYLYEFENVAEYYKYNFRDREQYKKIFKGVVDSDNPNREKLKPILEKQYIDIPKSDKTKKNIELFSKDNTLAIVTGQQLGILGGPLYTFYKIITTIKLSNFLNERYDDFNFVPVFWLAGDDHDFNEVRAISIIDNDNNIKTIGYKEEIDPEEAKLSVGKIKFDETIEEFFNTLNDSLRDTEFKQPVIEELKIFYKTGETFTSAFQKLIHSVFDEYGLVILNPQERDVKELLKPIFIKEITNFREHTEKLVHLSAQLEEIYHAQVKVKPVNLFFSTEDGRYSIEPVENEYKLKRKRKSFTQEELLNLVETEPERFSPNVLLRPICQDYILPTACYIGGPSELAYFAQATLLYDFYNIQTPIIYPRSSATVLEANINKILEKYNVAVNDIFFGAEEIKKKVIHSLTANRIDDIFAEAESEVELTFDRLREKLFELDKTIADTSKKYRGKIFSALSELKGKAEQAQNQKYEVTLRQLDRACTILFPSDQLQERILNYTYFVDKYGKDFIKKIFDQLDIDKFEHQIIEI